MKIHTHGVFAVKHLTLAVPLAAILLASGCTSVVSNNVSREGHVSTSDLIFPELSQAWQSDGIFPNQENLTKIRPGIGKDSLYQLIGPPHFSESQHAQEWDYIFKFYQDDGAIKVCQYKIIFDKNYHAQEFYWNPADCQQATQTLSTTAVTPVQPTQSYRQPIMSEVINLSADALFAFDKSNISDMNTEGRRSLNDLATKLQMYQNQGETKITITGYTDRLGDDSYNMRLSTMRAQTVKGYLAHLGVNPANIIAVGAGKTNPVKYCQNSLNQQALIDCLQPNRRVEVDVKVYEPSH